MKTCKTTMLVIAVLIAAFSFSIGAEEPEAFAKMMQAKGEVLVFRSGSEKAEAISRGDLLYAGDRVTLGRDSSAILVTKERKIINLSSDSELTVNAGAGDGATGLQGLGLGMFRNNKGRINPTVVAAVRDKGDANMLFLSPRNGVSRDSELHLQFAPLPEGYHYEVEIVSREPKFRHVEPLKSSELVLDEQLTGYPVKRGEPYFIYVKKYNVRGVVTDFEERLYTGLIGEDDLKKVQQVEKEVQPWLKDEKDSLAYLTVLAETYEEYFLRDEAIAAYERICDKVAPGDLYSLQRLEELYAEVQNGPKYRKVQETIKKMHSQ